MNKFIRVAILVLTLASAGYMFAQQHGATPQQQSSQQEKPGPTTPNATTDTDVSGASKSAETGKPAPGEYEEEQEENASLKYSASVKWIASKTGMTPQVAYWVFVGLNFAILAAAILWFSKSSVPAMLRNRTATIQKGIEEARKASAEATERLNGIEARLAKLDGEVTQLKASAEADFSAEEARIKQSAEEDARRVVESAEQEVAAASRSAQRELKAYAADLSVNLAEKKIKVDSETDEALLRGFVSQLGKDGK